MVDKEKITIDMNGKIQFKDNSSAHSHIQIPLPANLKIKKEKKYIISSIWWRKW